MKRVLAASALLLIVAPLAPALAGAAPETASEQSLREQVEVKDALADEIVAAAERRSGRDWDEVAKSGLRQALLTRSVTDLSEAAALGTPLEALMDTRAFGGNVDDLVFTPLPGCRILDTRPGSGAPGASIGPIVPGTPRSIFVAGTCGIPFPSAKAIAANFMAVDASGAGDLRVWPWDQTAPPQPPTPALAYTPSAIANGLVMPICNTATATGGTCGHDLFLQTNGSATYVAITVLGYFAAPRTTALDCVDVVSSRSLVAHGSVGFWAACPAGYSITGSGFDQGPAEGVEMHTDFAMSSTNATLCGAYNHTGVTQSVTCTARCCRIPGR